MNADGSNAMRLTHKPAAARPAWSRDGKRIAFARCTRRLHLFVMDADGNNVSMLPLPNSLEPAWSPRGALAVRIVTDNLQAVCKIFRMDATAVTLSE